MAPPSSARTTRSRASPAAGVAADAKTSGVQKKSFMERWLEPQVQSKASFQEAGLIRQGVLENMAPLGTLPKPAVTRAAAAEGKVLEQPPAPASGRRITIKFNKRPPSEPKTPKATPDSQNESTVSPESVASEGEEASEERDPGSADGEADAEAKLKEIDSVPDFKSRTPPPPSTRQSLSSRSPTLQNNQDTALESTAVDVPLTRSKFNMRKTFTSPRKSSGSPSQPPHLGTGTSSISSYSAVLDSNAGGSVVPKTPTSSTSSATAAMPTESRMVATRAREVVNIAVKEALVHQDYLSAWTIRHLFDENSGNPRVMDMFDQVFRQTAAEDVLIEFVHMIGKKKLEGHKTKQYRTMMPSDGQSSPSTPKPAPYRDLVKSDVLRIVKRAAERPRIAAPDTEPQAEAGLDTDRHKDKKQKIGGRDLKPKTPSRTKSRLTATGSPAQRSGRMAKTSGRTPRSHKRSLSNDSISSLSSAPSDLDEAVGAVFEAVEAQAPIPSPTVQAKRKGRSQGRRSTAAYAEPELPKGESVGTDDTTRTVGSVSAAAGAGGAGSFGGAAAPAASGPMAGKARAESARSSSKTRAVASQPITTGRRKSRRTGNASPTGIPTPQVSSQNPPPPLATDNHPISDNNNSAEAIGLTDSRMSVTKPTATKDYPSLSSATRKTTRQSTANSTNNNSNTSKASSPAPPPAQPKFNSKIGALDEDDPKTKLRRDAKLRTNAFITITESFTRGLDDPRSDGPAQDASEPPEPERELEPEPEPELPEQQERIRADADIEASAGFFTPTDSLKLRRPRAAHSSLRSTRSSRKRTHEDIEDEPSPSSAVFPSSVNPPASSSAVNSRASTPVPRPAKKAKTGLRVKTSPMKKKLGPSAGLPRATGDRGSPVATGAPSSLDENDDFCSSCNGQGELLCCETCRRAFHFKCVDPPLQRLNLPDEWFCNVCIARHRPTAIVHQAGAFRFLMTELNAKNSSAFRLPADVRSYFIGVDEGPDGEYEEAAPLVPKAAKKKTGYEEPPDFYRVRDQDGKAVVCHACDRPSDNRRTIIPCSLCTLNWHLDCLDPPMPYPPVLRTWRCPAHIDDLLMRLPGTLAPAHKRRRIKGASAVRPAYSRGLRNNGYIEVDDGEYDDVPPRPDLIGADSRLPAQGVVQDFVDTVRRRSSRKLVQQQNNAYYVTPTKDLQVARGALEILADACPQPVDGSSADKTGLLIAALVSGADKKLLSNVSRDCIVSIASGTGLAINDKSGLKVMLAELEKLTGNIRDVLAARPSTPGSPVAANNEPPSSMTTGESPPATVPQLTEGTEKSTPEAEEDNNVVTPITELEETNSPIKEAMGCEDVVMADEPMVAASDDSELITPVKSVPALAVTARPGSPSKK